MLAHREEEDRHGLLSCRTMRKTYGRVISFRSQTSSYARCLLFSLSICTLVESSILVSHNLLPMPGLHNNCERQPPMDNRRTISFVIVIASSDPVSLAWPQPAALRCSKRLTMLLGLMRSVNGFWGVCGESVSIIFSSSRRSSWIVSYRLMCSTSIKPDPIKASNNRSQNSMVSQYLRITRVARFSPSRSRVDYTTITAEVLELSRVCEEADGYVVWRASYGNSHIVSPILPFLSDVYNKQEVFVFPCKNASRFVAKASS